MTEDISEAYRKTSKEKEGGQIIIGGQTTPLSGKIVWAHASQESLSGNIPSNLISLISSVHSPITLTITKPVEVKEGQVEKTEKIRDYDYQMIGDTSGVSNSGHNLGHQWSEAVREAQDFTAQVETLNQNLARLRVDQSGEGIRLIKQALEKKEQLEKEQGEASQRLTAFQQNNFPDLQNPRIKSLNGDICLHVDDPEVLVIIQESSQQKESPQIIGNSPEDPKRKIFVSSLRGGISVRYPSRT